MIKDSPIVADTRKIRKTISAQFNHDIDRYINYLRKKCEADESDTKRAAKEKAKP